MSRCLNPGPVVKKEPGGAEAEDNRPSSPAESLRSFKDLLLPSRSRLPGLFSPPPSPFPSHPSFPPHHPSSPQDLFNPQKLKESETVIDRSKKGLDSNKEASAKKRKDNLPLNQNSKRRKGSDDEKTKQRRGKF